MKLLFCGACGDLFNLQPYLKTCRCGTTKGLYTDDVNAEVNGGGYSIAIGNGSLWQALSNIKPDQEDFRGPGKNVWECHPNTIICWSRPHEGQANPHTRINPQL